MPREPGRAKMIADYIVSTIAQEQSAVIADLRGAECHTPGAPTAEGAKFGAAKADQKELTAPGLKSR